MARIQTSALLNDISGKINGSVFQRTQGGLCMRSQGGKINSNTTRSNLHKVGLASVQGAWQSLTASERVLWNTYAIYLNKKQKKNPTLTINGHQLFININSIRYDLSGVNTLFQPYLLTTPVLTPVPQPINVTTIFSDGFAFSVSFDRVVDDTTEVIILFLSRPLISSQMSGYIKSTLMLTSTIASNSIIPTDYYKEVYGRVIQPGEFIQTKVAIYSTVSQNYSSFSVQRIQVS